MAPMDTPATSGVPVHGSIESAAAHERVAATLRRWVHLGIYEPEQRLPPTRALAEQLGVGRVTLQMGIKLLEEEGLLRTARGRGGGTFVLGTRRRGRPRKLPQEHIDDLRANYEFRLQIEPFVARMAAERATSEQRGRLVTEGSRTAKTVATFRANDSRFHMLLAEACGNAYATESIERTRAGLFKWIDPLQTFLAEQARTTEREHMEIALAVLHRDGDVAAELMTKHLAGAAASLARSLPPTQKGHP